jgi:hypothetical protein
MGIVSGPLEPPLYTLWDKLPLANSLRTGFRVFVPDVGTPGSFWYSNGIEWSPISGTVMLAMSAVPVIAVSSGTANTAGVITPTTPITSAGYSYPMTSWVRLPAGVVTNGLGAGLAGMFLGVWSSAASCQIKVNYYDPAVSFIPTLEDAGINATTNSGAYAQATIEITMMSYTLPANLMGRTGSIEVDDSWAFSGTSASKTYREKLGTLAIGDNTQKDSDNLACSRHALVTNRGVANLQTVGPYMPTYSGYAEAANISGTINTAVATLVSITGRCSTAPNNNFMILESFAIHLHR